mmetsp:Transcript_33743/g.84416  ORF Transcript_33743/g.84416 Transcript_33743/m.84416 type:complete len:124 (-) Transcript_33743:117-488(-)
MPCVRDTSWTLQTQQHQQLWLPQPRPDPIGGACFYAYMHAHTDHIVHTAYGRECSAQRPRGALKATNVLSHAWISKRRSIHISPVRLRLASRQQSIPHRVHSRDDNKLPSPGWPACPSAGPSL